MAARTMTLLMAVVAGAAAFAGEGGNALRNAAFAADGEGRIAEWRVEALRHEVVRGAGPAGEDAIRLPLEKSRTALRSAKAP